MKERNRIKSAALKCRKGLIDKRDGRCKWCSCSGEISSAHPFHTRDQARSFLRWAEIQKFRAEPWNTIVTGAEPVNETCNNINYLSMS
jgi:hypothetical protein